MYRWLPMSFDKDFAVMISVIENAKGEFRRSGMVQHGNEYHMIKDTTIKTDWDKNWYQTGMRVWVKTDQCEYEIEGKVLSIYQFTSRFYTNRMLSGIKQVLIGKIENILDSLSCFFRGVAFSPQHKRSRRLQWSPLCLCL
jgi:hypothetical protein